LNVSSHRFALLFSAAAAVLFIATRVPFSIFRAFRILCIFVFFGICFIFFQIDQRKKINSFSLAFARLVHCENVFLSCCWFCS